MNDDRHASRSKIVKTYSRIILVAGLLLLVIMTMIAFSPVLSSDFLVTLDDSLYVTDNPMVRSGLTAAGLRWALTAEVGGHWHPLTMISHMIDSSLFGLRPGGHHFSSLLLHCANTVLLFLLLRGMTGATGRSLMVAALFALHPLHVEAVAWISSRKDVLSTLFWMAALSAYLAWARRPGMFRYLLVLVLLALGLTAKAMLVSLPAVLLLLDYWPLGRLAAPRGRLLPLSGFWRCVLEKIPFVFLSAAMSLTVAMYMKRGGAMGFMDVYSLTYRMGNAVLSYGRYLLKTCWPSDLAVHYPYPEHGLPASGVTMAAIALIALSVAAFRFRRRYPWIIVGWLWFLLTLVPVIGLVQTGTQAMADRYTYVPLVGIFLAAIWSIHVMAGRDLKGPTGMMVVCVAILVALFPLTYRQAQHWRTNESLFRQEVRAAPTSYFGLTILGSILVGQGRTEEGVHLLEEALRLEPNYADAHYNLGVILQGRGNLAGAAEHYRSSIRSKPDLVVAYNNLGVALAGIGEYGQAVAVYQEAIRRDPGDALAWTNLGQAFEALGRLPEAAVRYQQALRLNPDDAESLRRLIRISGRRPVPSISQPVRQ